MRLPALYQLGLEPTGRQGLRNPEYQTFDNIFFKVCSLLHAYSSLINSGARS
jgi:hypothetical protein